MIQTRPLNQPNDAARSVIPGSSLLLERGKITSGSGVWKAVFWLQSRLLSSFEKERCLPNLLPPLQRLNLPTRFTRDTGPSGPGGAELGWPSSPKLFSPSNAVANAIFKNDLPFDP